MKIKRDKQIKGRSNIHLFARRIDSFVAVFPIVLMSAPCAIAGESGDSTVSSSLVKQGKELRHDIDVAYLNLARSGSINTTDGSNISDIVNKYIRPGISFAHAATIVTAAGFTLSKIPSAEESGSSLTGCVPASISPYVEKFPYRIDVFLSLCSAHAGEYSEGVQRVTAHIFASYP